MRIKQRPLASCGVESRRARMLLESPSVLNGVLVPMLNSPNLCCTLGFACLLVWVPLASAAPDFSGRWTLNKDKSDDAHERLQGLTVIRSDPTPRTEAEREREGKSRPARIYNELELAEERHLIRKEADVGELTHVLHTESVTVARIESGVEVTYDNGFKRQLKPRPGGQRYSAKGDEFVPDKIGRSMVFWRGSLLVVKTLLAPRGMMTEEFSLQPGRRRLEIHTVLRNPDWLIDADIVRVFDPAP